MSKAWPKWIVLLGLLASCSTQEQEEQPTLEVVKTTAGLITGTTSSEGTIHIYKGVPFAAPPVGDLRWKAPQPVKPWKDTLACTKFPASPIQNTPQPFMMWSQEFITPAEPLSEDCLYLNVWTGAETPQEKRPVLVWIHGGGFTSGSGACPIYDGEALAKEGIVYVSINYRLGVFGFMAHPELTAESANHASGNYGIMDQIAALKWIKENIHAFGGDPNKITIAGQSAGSMSVQAVVASPLSKGLFQQAIAESGAMTSRPTLHLEEAEKTGLQVAHDDDLNVLRQLPADSLLARANTLPFGRFYPIVDGYVLPADVTTIFEQKKHNDVSLLAGWVTGDADLVMRQPKKADVFRSEMISRFGSRAAEFLKLFPTTDGNAALESQRKLALLEFAALPDRKWAKANTSNSYLYQYSYVPTDKPGFPNYGAFHTSEVPFALHTLAHWDRPWTAVDKRVEEYLSSYWINFVKTGDPNGEGLAKWPAFDPSSNPIMEMGEEPMLETGMYSKEFAFLEKN